MQTLQQSLIKIDFKAGKDSKSANKFNRVNFSMLIKGWINNLMI